MNLYSVKKFERAIVKTRYTKSEERVNRIAEYIIGGSMKKKITSEINADRKKDIQQAVIIYYTSDMYEDKHIEEIAGINSYYDEQIKEHNQSSEKKFEKLMDVVINYKKCNIPQHRYSYSYNVNMIAIIALRITNIYQILMYQYPIHDH